MILSYDDEDQAPESLDDIQVDCDLEITEEELQEILRIDYDSN